MAARRTMSLSDVFLAHSEKQVRIDKLWKDLSRSFTELDEVSPADENQSAKPLLNELLNHNAINDIVLTLKKPAILFVGQLNAGKSFLINEIMGQTVLECSETACTGRMVQLTYGPKTEIRLVHQDGRIDQIPTKSDSKHIPRGLANPPGNVRLNAEIINSKIVAEFDINLLKSGVCIYDLPGFDECPHYAELLDYHVNSVLPLIVYVIDATRGLNNVDREKLKHLYKMVPHENVFFVVTKMDKLVARTASSSSDEEANTVSINPTSIKMGIYRYLIEGNFLPDVPITECRQYHVLSSWKIKQRREGKYNKSDGDMELYVTDFEKFKSCLVDFVQDKLNKAVKKGATHLKDAITTCLHYYVDISNQHAEKVEDTNKCFESLRKQGEDLLGQIVNEVQKSAPEFKELVSSRISTCKEDLKEACVGVTFENLEVTIPEDGHIHPNDVQPFKTKVKEFVLDELSSDLHRKLLQRMGVIDSVFTNVEDLITQFQTTLGKNTDLLPALRSIYLSQYRPDIRDVKLMKTWLERIREILSNLFRIFHIAGQQGIDLNEHDWKYKIVEDICDKVNPADVTNAIVEGINAYITEGHNNFLEKLNEAKRLTDARRQLSETARGDIREKSRRLGGLMLTAWDLIDRVDYKPESHIQFTEHRGLGGEGMVYNCATKGPNGESTVVKIIPIDDDYDQYKLGLEIFFTRQLEHANITPIFASVLSPIYESSELHIIMPRMKSNLHQALRNNIFPTLKSRLCVGIEIGEGLEYLHGKQILHRDIKPENVLLSEDNKVKLCDFGFCKTVGLAAGSKLGTPGFLAPETRTKNHHDTSTDVYAFGVVIWGLCVGPSYSNEMKKLTAEDGIPNLGLSDDCWKLIQSCTDNESSKRPTVNAVIEMLNTVVDGLAEEESYSIDSVPFDVAISAKC